MINCEQLDKGGEALLGRYRVRLVASDLVPFCYKHDLGDLVLVVDLPEAEGYEAEAIEAYRRFQSAALNDKSMNNPYDDDKENLPTDCVIEGDPLKVTFLSVEKLDQMAAANKSRFDNGLELISVGCISGLDLHLMPSIEAHALINEFSQCHFFSDDLDQHAVILFCETTESQPVFLLGRRNTNKKMMTMRAFYFGDFNTAIDELNKLSADMDKFSLRKMCCRCRFNVLDDSILVEKDQKEDGNFVPALFTIDVEWNPDKRFAGSGGYLRKGRQMQYLQMPPNNASATVKFKPGWMDGRILLTDRINELRYLAQLAAHLKAGTLPWTSKNEQKDQHMDVIDRAANLINNAKDTLDAQPMYPFDFTDRLWDVLKLAKSIEMLRRVFQQIYDQLQTGEFRVLVEASKVSSLAKMLRMRNPDEIIFPRLEPMICLQLLIEIGVDRFNGELTHRFLTGDFLPNTLDLEPFFLHSSSSLENRIERLIPLHLALQSMMMIEIYVKLPPHEKTNMAKKLLAHFTAMDGTDAFEKEFVYKASMEDIHFEKLKNTLSNWIFERDFDKWTRQGVLSKYGAISDVVHIFKNLGVRHFSQFHGQMFGSGHTAALKTEAASSPMDPSPADGGTEKQTDQYFECAYLIINTQSTRLLFVQYFGSARLSNLYEFPTKSVEEENARRFSEADELLRANPELLQYTDSARRMAVHYAADDTGWTLLLIASSSGHLEIVRLLMNFQVDVNHRISTGQSALHFAWTTPLHKAASQGHQRIVNLLMGNREKLQIDLPNREGDTPLHLACEDQQIDVALFLVRSGANLEKKNRQNQTPTNLVSRMEHKLRLAKASESVKPTAGT
uniref:Protein zwilch n=1 Tax=Globodera pallida TaxID=36090 RepID=A0A183BHY7_GLOPA